jgi:Skp family chaperone for outer membrane proteins
MEPTSPETEESKPRPLTSMSTDRATGIESTGTTDEESADQLTQLQCRVDALEDEKERVENELRAELEEAHSEIEDLQTELVDTKEQQREDRHALARENHELRASHEQLEERIEKTEEKDGLLLDDIIDLEQQLADVEAGSAGSKGGGDTDETTMQRTDMTPIERVSEMNVEDTGIDVTPSIERAVSIFDHWREWSNKTPKGRVLKSGLKNLLRTATGESLAWRQVYRAAEALEELSKGRIEFIDHRKHGKMLVESEPARTGHCQSSSAATS